MIYTQLYNLNELSLFNKDHSFPHNNVSFSVSSYVRGWGSPHTDVANVLN